MLMFPVRTSLGNHFAQHSERFVGEPFQRNRGAFLRLPIAPPWEDLQLSERVYEVAGLEGSPRRLGSHRRNISLFQSDGICWILPWQLL